MLGCMTVTSDQTRQPGAGGLIAFACARVGTGVTRGRPGRRRLDSGGYAHDGLYATSKGVVCEHVLYK